jgi:hypothetical protein
MAGMAAGIRQVSRQQSCIGLARVPAGEPGLIPLCCMALVFTAGLEHQGYIAWVARMHVEISQRLAAHHGVKPPTAHDIERSASIESLHDFC